MAVYYIGGSPCSGKSTVAQALAEQYGFHYFKVDDHLDRYMQMGADDGKACCAALQGMSADQIWMRDPLVQCEEELQIYKEIWAYIRADLAQLDASRGVITEGAAFLPSLAQQCGIPAGQYISITPTKAFQVEHYRQREWVPYVLAECSDQEQAFAHWMDRDALFAQAVQQQCLACGYVSLINDGSISVAEMISRVRTHWGLT